MKLAGKEFEELLFEDEIEVAPKRLLRDRKYVEEVKRELQQTAKQKKVKEKLDRDVFDRALAREIKRNQE